MTTIIGSLGILLQNLGEGLSKGVVNALDMRISEQNKILEEISQNVRTLEYSQNETPTDNLRRMPELFERPLLGFDTEPIIPDPGKPEISEHSGSM